MNPARVAAVLGAALARAEPVRRGYSRAGRFLLHLADGRRAFLKEAVDEQSAAWLRAERLIYGDPALRGAPFLPRLLAFDDPGAARGAPWPALYLENLSAALWPPPWSDALVARVLTALKELARVPVPAGVPELGPAWARTAGWRDVAATPGPLLALGLCDAAWLQAALPRLLAAADPALLAGDALLHMDIRSDNLCFTADRVLFIDWNWACRGAAVMELALFAPSLHAEGGPPPEALLPAAPGPAALVSGLLAARAGLPEELVPPGVRAGQRRQLRVALPWAARALGLPPPW